jgi:hypothetical protein
MVVDRTSGLVEIAPTVTGPENHDPTKAQVDFDDNIGTPNKVYLEENDGTERTVADLSGGPDYSLESGRLSPGGEWVVVLDNLDQYLLIPTTGGRDGLASDATRPLGMGVAR